MKKESDHIQKHSKNINRISKQKFPRAKDFQTKIFQALISYNDTEKNDYNKRLTNVK